MKTAIVYYSMHGNIRYVAKKVADELGADLIELVPKKAYPDKGMIKFIWENNDLTGKKIAVITTSAGGDSSKCIEALKTSAKAESLVASLSLVEPKDHPSEANDKKIAEFINSCKC